MPVFRLTVIVVVLVLFGSTGVPQKKSDWRIFSANKKHYWMYSPKRVTRTAKGITRIWVKQTPSHDSLLNGDAKRELIRKREELGLTTRGYENWSYSLIQFDLKCRERKTRLIMRTDYNSEGDVLDTDEEPGHWDEVVPESVAERMLNVACNRRK
jgi:hypothetical protein